MTSVIVIFADIRGFFSNLKQQCLSLKFELSHLLVNNNDNGLETFFSKTYHIFSFKYPFNISQTFSQLCDLMSVIFFFHFILFLFFFIQTATPRL